MVAHKAAVASVAAMLAFAASAAPAPWYQWKSKLDGKTACLQSAPGQGWSRDSGPYHDARCAASSSSSSPRSSSP